MKLPGNTVLKYGKAQVNDEIFALEQQLLFKPWFYHREQDFPCIILNHLASGWEPGEKLDRLVEEQIREDLASLKFTAKANFRMRRHNAVSGKAQVCLDPVCARSPIPIFRQPIKGQLKFAPLRTAITLPVEPQSGTVFDKNGSPVKRENAVSLHHSANTQQNETRLK